MGRIFHFPHRAALWFSIVPHRTALCLLSLILFFAATTTASAATIQAQHRPWAQTNNLLAYWTLDGKDTINNFSDVSGNGYHCRLDGAGTSTLKVIGKSGQGALFNGSNQRLNCGDIAALAGQSKLTISAWMKRRAVNSKVDIIQYYDGGIGYGIGLEFWSNGMLGFHLNSGASGIGEYALNDTEWHFVTLVFDGTLTGDANRLKGYVDGVQQTLTFTVPGVPATTPDLNTPFYIGHDGSSSYTDGSVDEVRIYTRAFSAAEVKALYAVGQGEVSRTLNTTIKSGLVGWWTFDGNSGTNPATFGETTVLGLDDGNNGNYMLAQAATTSYDLTVSSMSFYVNTAVGDLRMGIYDEDGPGDGPGSKLAETNAFTPTTGWNTVDLTSPTTIPAGRYWIAHLPSSNSLRYPKHGTVGKYCYYSYTFGAMPATFSASPVCGTDHWSIYASGQARGIGMDKSGNANSVALLSGLAPSMGKIGQGLNFDGTNDCAVGDPSASLNNLSALTVTGWIYPQYYDIFGPHGFIMQKGDSSSPPSGGTHYSGWDLSFQPGNPTSPEFGVDYGTNNLYRRAADYIFTENEWQYITVTWDGTANATGIHMYRNGVEISYNESQDGSGGRTADESNGIRLGCNTALDSIFKGSLDDMRVYNRELSATEVKQLYNEGVGTIVAKNQTSKVSDGLVGYWSFNGPDLTDKVYDRSTQGNNGYFYGGATSSAKTIGKVGQGLTFDGSNDYISIVNESPFDFDIDDPFTLAAWINVDPASDAKENDIIEKVDAGFNGYGFYRDNIGILLFAIHDIADGDYIRINTDSTSLAPAGQWTHVVATYDGGGSAGGMRIYANGANASVTINDNGTVGTSLHNDNLLIGDDIESDGCCNFGGKIDEVRIYNRALSAAEIKQLYNLGR